MGINKLLGFVLFIYIARILGATEYGKFSFALAFISLFSVFQDLGISTIVTREFTKEGEKEEEFHSLISLEILLSAVTFILILFSSFFVTAEPDIRRAILILALYGSTNSMIGFFYSFFQGRQRMEYQTWPAVAQSLLVTILGIFILFRFPSVENLSYVYLIASLVALIFVLIIFNIKVFNLRISWSVSVWRKFLIMSWPLVLTSLFGTLYSYTDSIMLGYWKMLSETGWYNAAYRIIYVVSIPMGLISGSFYPALSKLFKESKEKLQKIWDYQLELMILFALPIMVGGIVLAPKIIYFFYPSSFSPSILALQILIVMAGLIFLCRPFSDLMIASRQPKINFWITVSGALTNVLLNLFLIPKYKLYGAAVATVITYIVVLLMNIGLTEKFTPVRIPYLKFLSIFILAGLSSTLMYFVVTQQMIYNLNIFLSITIGALVYIISLLFLKRITESIYEKI